MTREDIVGILEELSIAYLGKFKFPSGDPRTDGQTIQIWHGYLRVYPKDIVVAAVRGYVKSGKEWPPSLGQVIEMVGKVADPEAITSAEAWHKLIRAVDMHSIYYRPDEVKAALSPEVWDAAVIVGLDAIAACSPGDTYLMTHFCKVFDQQQQIRKERELLASAKKQIGGEYKRLCESEGG